MSVVTEMKAVQLTQYVHPHGEKRTEFINVPANIAEMAKDQVLSCEMMPHNYSEVVFYSRKKHWDSDFEEIAIAENGPGEKSPANTLARLIEQVHTMPDPVEVEEE